MAEGEEEVFSIERIVDKKITKDGRVKYFLKWKDYPETDNTWEMAEDLDCDDLIQAFEQELKEKKAAGKVDDNELLDSSAEAVAADEGAEDAVDEVMETDNVLVEENPLGSPVPEETPAASSPTADLITDDVIDPFTSNPGEDPLAGETGETLDEPTPVSPTGEVNGAAVVENGQVLSGEGDESVDSGLKGKESRVSGFDKGYTVETIIGITPRKKDKYAFLIKWKEVQEPTLEDREICNQRCPLKIIKFYEKRLVWMK